MSMQIQKGMVKEYKDYSNVVINYGVVKRDDGEIQYYFMDDKVLPNGCRIATKALVEAIDPTLVCENVGMISSEGVEVVPFENKSIKEVSDNVLLIEKAQAVTPSVLEAIQLRSDPLAATQLVTTSATIKDKMNALMGPEGRYILNDQFSEGTLIDYDGNNLVNGQLYSYVGISGGQLYLSTNDSNSEIATMPLQASVVEEVAPVEAVETVESIAPEVPDVPSEPIPAENVDLPTVPEQVEVETVAPISGDAVQNVEESSVPVVENEVVEPIVPEVPTEPIVSDAPVVPEVPAEADLPEAIAVPVDVESVPEVQSIGSSEPILPEEAKKLAELQNDIVTEVPVVENAVSEPEVNEVTATDENELPKEEVAEISAPEEVPEQEDAISEVVGNVDVPEEAPVDETEEDEVIAVVPENTEEKIELNIPETQEVEAEDVEEEKEETEMPVEEKEVAPTDVFDSEPEFMGASVEEPSMDEDDTVERLADAMNRLKEMNAEKSSRIEELENIVKQQKNSLLEANAHLREVNAAGKRLSERVKKQSATIQQLEEQNSQFVASLKQKDEQISSLTKGNDRLREIYDFANSILEDGQPHKTR